MTRVTIEINESKLPYLAQTLELLDAEIVKREKKKLTASERRFCKN